MSDMSDISATRIKSTNKSTTVGCLYRRMCSDWSRQKNSKIQPRHKKNTSSVVLSVRPANGMSSVLNIQSVFFFSIHPRSKTNILPSCRVSYHIQTGLFATEWEGGGGGKHGSEALSKTFKNSSRYGYLNFTEKCTHHFQLIGIT